MSYIEEILLGKKPLDRRATRLLRRAALEHPYSQILHMLYAKALMVNGKSGLGKANSRALLCAPNRRRHKEFMHKSLSDGFLPLQQKAEDNTLLTQTATESETQGSASGQHMDSPGSAEVLQQKERKKASGKQRTDPHTLIDRFLETSPRIGQIKTEVTQGEMSRESIEDHPGIVSETLAEVLVKQGKTERAKGIYKKLSLMFPEKSAYFAKKINSI